MEGTGIKTATAIREAAAPGTIRAGTIRAATTKAGTTRAAAKTERAKVTAITLETVAGTATGIATGTVAVRTITLVGEDPNAGVGDARAAHLLIGPILLLGLKRRRR